MLACTDLSAALLAGVFLWLLLGVSFVVLLAGSIVSEHRHVKRRLVEDREVEQLDAAWELS